MSSVLSSNSVHCAFSDNILCSSLQLSHVPLAFSFGDRSHVRLKKDFGCHCDSPIPATFSSADAFGLHVDVP